MSDRKVIILRPESPLSIEVFSAENNSHVEDVLRDLRNIMQEHFKIFGIKPFNLAYDQMLGPVLSATSSVGRLAGSLIDLIILPKIPDISISKLIGLSQTCKSSSISFNNESKIRAAISIEKDYTLYEILSLSLIDSVNTVINNGVERTFVDIIRPSRDKSGEIQIQGWINNGLVPPPLKRLMEHSYNILPNQIIVAALEKCLKESRSERIKILLRQCLLKLTEVDSSSLKKVNVYDIFLYKYSLPRKDYKRALSNALCILKGSALNESVSDHIPSFVIDLDVLFEEYCSQTLKDIMCTKKFVFFNQKEFDHPTSPRISKKIKPDLVIYNKKTKRSVIIDLKNKYSSLCEKKDFIPSNPDLFQIAYYGLALKSTYCLLVYPNNKPKYSFPVNRGAGLKAYLAKVMLFKKKASELTKTFFPNINSGLKIGACFVDLSGSTKQTYESLVSLALWIEYLTDSND